MTERKQHSIQRILFIIISIVVLLPILQHITGIVNVKPLKGDIPKVTYQPFSWGKWNNGVYTEETEQYLQYSFGFQPEMVRIDNQLSFSLFGETRAKNVLIGKSGYLFEKNYIEAWNGSDYVGKNELQKRVLDFKTIQDSLQVRGKNLLLILAAGKASFYPEYIPDSLYHITDSTNYKTYKDLLLKEGVNHIDFNDWFIQNKTQSKYPLYPKTGTHWSEYGMLLAADSIIAKAQEMFPLKDLGTITWDEVEYVNEQRYVDKDIEESFNLYTSFPNFKMAYPKVQFDTIQKDNINVIMISDSFFWRMFNIGIMLKIFKNGQFWYYNNVSYLRHFKYDTPVKDLDLEKEIKNTDLVVMMATEGNLKYFPWGGKSQFLKFFNRESTFDAERVNQNAIKKMIAKMKGDKKWMKYLQQKAQEQNLPLDTVIYQDAVYMLQQK